MALLKKNSPVGHPIRNGTAQKNFRLRRTPLGMALRKKFSPVTKPLEKFRVRCTALGMTLLKNIFTCDAPNSNGTAQKVFHLHSERSGYWWAGPKELPTAAAGGEVLVKGS